MAQLIACPECKKHLQVPEELMGKLVQCPECKNTFTAASPDEIGSTPSSAAAAPPVPAPSKTPAWEKNGSGRSPGKKRKSDDDDSYDVKDRDEDDEDDDGEARRRRRRRESASVGRGNYLPHRGGMILAFGIISLFFMPFVFGPIAWIMGNSDLRDIREGRMDPEGESNTQAGRIIGMISTFLSLGGVFLCCAYLGCMFMIGIGAAAGGGPRPGPPARRRF